MLVAALSVTMMEVVQERHACMDSMYNKDQMEASCSSERSGQATFTNGNDECDAAGSVRFDVLQEEGDGDLPLPVTIHKVLRPFTGICPVHPAGAQCAEEVACDHDVLLIQLTQIHEWILGACVEMAPQLIHQHLYKW